ncbi:MAG: hypothetical protein RLZZ165_1863 [Bacteroidota bacterium]
MHYSANACKSGVYALFCWVVPGSVSLKGLRLVFPRLSRLAVWGHYICSLNQCPMEGIVLDLDIAEYAFSLHPLSHALYRWTKYTLAPSLSAIFLMSCKLPPRCRMGWSCTGVPSCRPAFVRRHGRPPLWPSRVMMVYRDLRSAKVAMALCVPFRRWCRPPIPRTCLGGRLWAAGS